ncbi:MAG: hypothetical protein AVDCRST_MAG60-1566 [uncultured Nocardioides sp.]|uniref:HTH luxR-type domain-containing protein n=1 Tax=uncultured Nocardioides sp. TaxID=198441 RepID=A0A6J4NL76_9ACTN|nr:MAG: hypothetical protein AVDCRST_MAG60-1566 [uncultured Nocardioides sp.]
MTSRAAAWAGQHEGLSARESEVLGLIVCGLSNREIASRTELSVVSVRTVVLSAYERMGVTSRSQAVRWGLEHGFRIANAPSGHTTEDETR